MDVIDARLDEQDSADEGLNEKVDRLAWAVHQVSEASERSRNAITPLSRRIDRLDGPGRRRG
ncbi:hypothetical protein DXV76_14985 [Rhodobacteraceae bacterium CCMM004]|nr:hypothetical protein DXV76_14985 [Rhodobacteraceae bacterium CCMM004]